MKARKQRVVRVMSYAHDLVDYRGGRGRFVMSGLQARLRFPSMRAMRAHVRSLRLT